MIDGSDRSIMFSPNNPSKARSQQKGEKKKAPACPHSYLLKYGEVTKADSNREAVARFKKKREKKMHYKWGDTKSIFR